MLIFTNTYTCSSSLILVLLFIYLFDFGGSAFVVRNMLSYIDTLHICYNNIYTIITSKPRPVD